MQREDERGATVSILFVIMCFWGLSVWRCSLSWNYFTTVSYMNHFVGCECPEGWTGSHCQNAVDTAATDDMLQAATSKTSIGRVVGLLVLSVFVATLLLMFCDSSKKEKEKKKRRVDAKSGRSYRDRQQAHAGGEMA
jgi:hypothetical protein